MATEQRAPLRLGSTAPNFKAETSKGPIDFHEFIGDSWAVLFSHPVHTIQPLTSITRCLTFVG